MAAVIFREFVFMIEQQPNIYLLENQVSIFLFKWQQIHVATICSNNILFQSQRSRHFVYFLILEHFINFVSLFKSRMYINSHITDSLFSFLFLPFHERDLLWSYCPYTVKPPFVTNVRTTHNLKISLKWKIGTYFFSMVVYRFSTSTLHTFVMS